MPDELGKTSADDILFVVALSKDLRSFVQSNAHNCVAASKTGYVIDVSHPTTAPSATTRTVDASIDIDTADDSCLVAQQAASCLSAYIGANCFPLTNTKALLPSQATLFACAASAMRVTQTNPCGATSCAAAEDNLTREVSTKQEDSKAWIAGVVIGILVVAIIAAVIYKFVFFNRRRRGAVYSDDNNRYTKRFRLESVAKSDLALTAQNMFQGEELELGRYQEEEMFRQNQVRRQSQGVRASQIDLSDDEAEIDPLNVGGARHPSVFERRPSTMLRADSPGPGAPLLDDSERRNGIDLNDI